MWSDECDVLENFKSVNFVTSDGVQAPKARIIPLKDIPTVVQTSVEKECLKKKKKDKINNLFCDFCEKRNHITNDCFHLKAFDINKSSVIKPCASCTVCGKTNHETQQCTYLKSYEVVKNDFVAKTKVLSKPLISKSVVSTAIKTQSAVHNKTSAASTSAQKATAVPKQQRFIPVETAVTKQLNRTDVKRNIQVNDVPPFHLHSKNATSSSYSRVPHAYEALKKVSKPRFNRHPFGYQQLLGKNPQQWLGSAVSKTDSFTTDLTTVASTVVHSDPIETPSKAILALDSLLN